MEVLRNAGIMASCQHVRGRSAVGHGDRLRHLAERAATRAAASLSLATVFASVAGVAVGFINSLIFITRGETVTFSPPFFIGIAESLVTLFTGFGCLTVAWLCVTIGLWRRP